jgi:hypothetical protein
LTSHERAVLHFLVRGSAAAVCQVDSATVTEECVDHCGSVALSVRRGACAPTSSENGLLANAEWRDGDALEDMQDVLLFIEGGFLCLLETYRGDAVVPAGLPQVAGLRRLLGPDGPTPWSGEPPKTMDV